MKKKKLSRSKSIKPTRNSALVVKITAISLGLLFVILANHAFNTSNGDALGVETVQVLKQNQLTDEPENMEFSAEQTPHSKLKIQTTDGVMTIIGYDDEENQTQLDGEEVANINSYLKSSAIKIVPSNGSNTVMAKGNVAFKTELVIFADLKENSFMVSTSKGMKQLTFMPNDVVKDFTDQNLVDYLISEERDTSLPNITHVIRLKESRGGTAVFVIKGADRQKFLGLIPDSIKHTYEISAENGELLSESTSFIDKIKDLLSF